MARTFRQMLNDRLQKQGLYDSPVYWDMKASSYEGLARSNWPNNRYNALVHDRQMAAIDALLPDVTGLRIADVGCGTGRVSAHLARRGAEVTGWDFSPAAVEAAKRENADLGVDFRVGNVFDEPAEADRGAYDLVLTLGCLTLACKNEADFDRAVLNLVSLARPSGARVLFVEPVHRSRLLRRILRMSMNEWIGRCEALGLRFERRGGICFVPSRMMLAFWDVWPEPVARVVFGAGEAVLDASSVFEALADYKSLLFRR